MNFGWFLVIFGVLAFGGALLRAAQKWQIGGFFVFARLFVGFARLMVGVFQACHERQDQLIEAGRILHIR